ncbi:MAG TPA: EAL domain-containing protein [Pseudonocardiaceae bacterium]
MPMIRRPGRMAIAVAAVLVVVHLVDPTGVAGTVAFLLAIAGSGVAAWRGVARSTPGYRRFALLLATAVTSSALGGVVHGVLAATAPTPPAVSPADVLWVAGYGAVVLALLTLLHREGRRRWDAEGMIDAAVAFVAALLVLVELVFPELLGDTSRPLVARLVSVLYPVLDTVLLALVVRLVMRHRSRHGATVAIGVTCWLLADFGLLLVAPGGTLGRLFSAGWLVGTVLLAASTHVREPSDPASTAGTPREVTRRRVAVGLVPVLVPVGVQLGSAATGHRPNLVLLAVATVLLLGLTYLRAARLVAAGQAARDRMASRERHSAALAANSSDAVLVLDDRARPIGDGRRLAEFLGIDEDGLRGGNLSALVHPDDAAEATAVFGRALERPGAVLETTLRVRRGDGRPRWLSARLVNLLGHADVRGVVVNLGDITDRKRAEEELERLAFHDALTGLPNRALFRDRLRHALDRTGRGAAGPTVIFLDLDGFKLVNDSLGHDAGDELLREAARRLAAAVRRTDTVGRLGGDEFAVLIERGEHPAADAVATAERILRALSAPVTLSGGHRVTLTASLGVAVGDRDSTAAGLLRDADVAMYRAKADGKGRWVVHEPGMRTSAAARLELEADLRDALAAGRLRLLYQPVLDLETGLAAGFEALLRWQHPRHGTLAPDVFMGIAEETGLIVPIGRWVLMEATRTAARWRQAPGVRRPFTMAVNVSARQLESPGLLNDVADALDASGLEASALVLEMTETMLVRDQAEAAERLHALRRLGVRIAIDDFGTGFSSLSHLRRFPADILKIDRSFIATITGDAEVPELVLGLLDLGRRLRLEIVAEGVETDVQRRWLRDHRCDLAQGALFAPPLPARDAEALLVPMTPTGLTPS